MVYHVDLVGNTTGVYLYDYTNKRALTTRVNGKVDRFCGTVLGGDHACNHLVLNGTRYLVYPDLKFCCNCCDDAHGCGVIKPDFLSTAKYLSTTNEVNLWYLLGGQDNFYNETIGSVPLRFN
jgi:hypothetical protein